MPLDKSQHIELIQHQNLSFCKIAIFDLVISDSLLTLAQTIKTIAEKQNICYFLVDFRHSPYMGGILDLYDLAYTMFEKIGYRRSWKTALIVAEDDNSYNFLETVSNNNTYQLKCFIEMDEAIDWFKS